MRHLFVLELLAVLLAGCHWNLSRSQLMQDVPSEPPVDPAANVASGEPGQSEVRFLNPGIKRLPPVKTATFETAPASAQLVTHQIAVQERQSNSVEALPFPSRLESSPEFRLTLAVFEAMAFGKNWSIADSRRDAGG